jgi:hypothetical protein
MGTFVISVKQNCYNWSLLFRERKTQLIEDNTYFRFYCVECLAESPQDCICKKILRYDKETGIPVVALTNEEWEYLSKSGTNKNEGAV